MEKTRVMIADRDTRTAEYTEYMLGSLGYKEITRLSDCSNLVAEVAKAKPNLLLLNIELDEKKGAENCSSVIIHTHKIPVVFIIEHTDDETLEQATNCSPYGFLMKPYEKIELFSVIQTAMHNHKSRMALEESEKRFRALTKNSSDITYILDENLVIQFESYAVENTLYYKQGERIGKPLSDYIQPEDAGMFSQFAKRLLENPTRKYSSELRLRAEPGSWKYFEIIASNHLQNPAINGFVLNSRDISDRKVAEHQISRISKAVEGASDAIIISDLSGKSLYHNEAFINLFGYTVEKFNRDGGLPLIHTDKEVLDSILEFIRQDISWHGEVEMTNPQGQELLVMLRVDSLLDESGEINGMVSIHSDITEHRLIQEEISKLEKQNTALAMAVTASHEINQPLMILHGNLEMLEMKMPREIKEKHIKYFIKIHNSVDRIQNILEKFRQAGSIEFDDYTEGTQMLVFNQSEGDTD
ncbi:MAG: PAS domain S-box protein [Candidatus Cloacimonetes bacterium]|nr:PAS domain S-box protein [Candidatus Cloacimonadota bacterium]